MSELIPIHSPGAPLFFGHPGDPLVLVMHDWYGRLPELEDFAGRLSSEGFRVAVPDLYAGVATLNDDDAAGLMAGMDVGTALAEFDEIIQVGHDEGSRRFAAVGFSIGGWLALLHAQGGAEDAVVAYYASLSAEDHGVLPEPVLLHYAERDEWAPGEEPDAFITRMTDDGTPVERHGYFDTDHSFANLAIEGRANIRATRLAEERTVAFLREHLL